MLIGCRELNLPAFAKPKNKHYEHGRFTQKGNGNKLPFTKEELISKVAEGIRNNGYYGFYWGRYTSKDMREFGSDSIHIVMDWIREEGFRIEREVSVYGVPNYYASL